MAFDWLLKQNVVVTLSYRHSSAAAKTIAIEACSNESLSELED